MNFNLLGPNPQSARTFENASDHKKKNEKEWLSLYKGKSSTNITFSLPAEMHCTNIYPEYNPNTT